MKVRNVAGVIGNGTASTERMSSSLSAQAAALNVPSLDHHHHHPPSSQDDTSFEGGPPPSQSETDTDTDNDNNNNNDPSSLSPPRTLFSTHTHTPPTTNYIMNQFLSSPTTAPEPPMMFPLHSDFTVPTSNKYVVGSSMAPPMDLSDNNNKDDRRNVFGRSVGQRYAVIPQAPSLSSSIRTRTPSLSSSIRTMTPPQSPIQTIVHEHLPLQPAISPLTPAHNIRRVRNSRSNLLQPTPNQKQQQQEPEQSIHETVHAQSLLLGIAFMAIWSPNNVMAPNLTQMAESFGMTERDRDLYLGSYCALAVGVFSLPISALIGFMADFYPRKHLFVACVVGGSIASACTGWSTTFGMLFLARLTSGGCMSASVPVAFSLLGDLFSTEERNAASSGLTAMMGLGIIAGQVYAGTVGPSKGWEHPFFVSSLLSLMTAVFVILWVREPDRGAKEKVLQDMLQAGNKYDRQLTFQGFIHAMRHNQSNSILLWQGFFTSLPWGIVFVFLNDYLSQEKGFSVPDATFMVMLFGIGCAIGGICGGYIGQVLQSRYNRSYLPLFMAVTTFLGIAPFVGLLNSTFANHHGYKAMGYSILGGCIASLPSVNVRPIIINVNPPETRGAALTAANLLITLGRGIGPSCITLMGTLLQVSRQAAFNITLTGFWTISALQLLLLAKTLPKDQDLMEAELARYAAMAGAAAAAANKDEETQDEHHHHRHDDNDNDDDEGIETTLMNVTSHSHNPSVLIDDGESLVSIEDYMTSFDGVAARRSIQFMRQGIRELKDEVSYFGHACGSGGVKEESSDDDDTSSNNGGVPLLQEQEKELSREEIEKRRQVWIRQQQQQRLSFQNDSSLDAPTEQTPLLV